MTILALYPIDAIDRLPLDLSYFICYYTFKVIVSNFLEGGLFTLAPVRLSHFCIDHASHFDHFGTGFLGFLPLRRGEPLLPGVFCRVDPPRR
jgi:hypothetical protein